MRTQHAAKASRSVTGPGTSPVPRTVPPVARFFAELGGMCAVMCIGGMVLSFVCFAVAGWLGSANLARQAPELAVLIIAVCLGVPMPALLHRRPGR